MELRQTGGRERPLLILARTEPIGALTLAQYVGQETR
jgi:hypothetical protein